MVLFSIIYNFRTESSLISKQAIFDSNFSRNIHVYLDISFSGQLVLKNHTRVIYTYASFTYYSEIDMAYN